MSNRNEPRKKIIEYDITVWQVTNLINTAVCWSEFLKKILINKPQCLDTSKEIPLFFIEKKIPSSPMKPKINKASNYVSVTLSMTLHMQQQYTFASFCFLYVFLTWVMDEKIMKFAVFRTW